MRITAEEVTRHPFTKKVVRKYTQRLIKFGCYTEDEREAVEQELMSKLIANWPKFDEAGNRICKKCARINASLKVSEESPASRSSTLSIRSDSSCPAILMPCSIDP